MRGCRSSRGKLTSISHHSPSCVRISPRCVCMSSCTNSGVRDGGVLFFFAMSCTYILPVFSATWAHRRRGDRHERRSRWGDQLSEPAQKGGHCRCDPVERMGDRLPFVPGNEHADRLVMVGQNESAAITLQ